MASFLVKLVDKVMASLLVKLVDKVIASFLVKLVDKVSASFLVNLYLFICKFYSYSFIVNLILTATFDNCCIIKSTIFCMNQNYMLCD